MAEGKKPLIPSYRPGIPPGQPTLPPLRSLDEPVYVIPERKDAPHRNKPAAAAARTVQKKQARRPAKKPRR
jgi:hypothetical protein